MASSTRHRRRSTRSPSLGWIAALCLLGACSAPAGDGPIHPPTPAPPWTVAPPTLDGGRWIAAGWGAAPTIDEAEALAVAAARAALLAFRVARFDDPGAPTADEAEDGSGSSPVDPLTERLTRLDARDTLTAAMPADGERFARRLDDGSVEAFVQVSADELELIPQRRLQEAQVLADPAQRAAQLIELARAFLLRGMDAHCQVALEWIEREQELAPALLVELAGLHLLLGRRDDALVANARALELLLARSGDEVLLARAREQQIRLVSGIASIEDSLLDLERLTRATRRDEVLSAPLTEVLCEDTQMSTVEIVVGGEAGRLAPLWIDADGVRLVNLSDDGRVFGSALQLSLGLSPEIDSATLLIWLLPEDQAVLHTLDSLRGERLPSADGSATDAQRLLLQALLEGLRKASADLGVGAVRVHLRR